MYSCHALALAIPIVFSLCFAGINNTTLRELYLPVSIFTCHTEEENVICSMIFILNKIQIKQKLHPFENIKIKKILK